MNLIDIFFLIKNYIKLLFLKNVIWLEKNHFSYFNKNFIKKFFLLKISITLITFIF